LRGKTGKLSQQLRNAWDGRAMSIARSRKRPVRATRAHISLLGNITPAELTRYYARLRNAGGLESRILFAYVTKTRDLSPFQAGRAPGDLADQLRQSLEHSKEGVLLRADPITARLCEWRGVQPNTVIPVAEQVQADWLGLKRQLPAVDRDLGSMFNRAEDNVIRLALTYALADRAASIRMEHINAAMALWEYCARSAEVIFRIPVGSLPPAMNARHVAVLVKAMHERWPGWVPKSYINDRVFRGNVRGAEIDAILGHLADRGLIEERRLGTTGRPRTEYRLVSSFPVFPSEEE
jgi:hypothetical protein